MGFSTLQGPPPSYSVLLQGLQHLKTLYSTGRQPGTAIPPRFRAVPLRFYCSGDLRHTTGPSGDLQRVASGPSAPEGTMFRWPAAWYSVLSALWYCRNNISTVPVGCSADRRVIACCYSAFHTWRSCKTHVVHIFKKIVKSPSLPKSPSELWWAEDEILKTHRNHLSEKSILTKINGTPIWPLPIVGGYMREVVSQTKNIFTKYFFDFS